MSGDYKLEYLSIKNDYDIKCSTDSLNEQAKLDEQITKLDAANNKRVGPIPVDPWSATASYAVNSFVRYDNKLYKCISAAPPGIGPYGGYIDGSAGNTIRWRLIEVSELPTGPFDNTNEVQTAFAPISQYYANLRSIKERLERFLKDSSEEVADGHEHLLHEERYIDSVYPERSMKARELSYGLIPELKTQTIPVLISVGAAMLAFAIVLSFQLIGVNGQLNLSPAYAQGYATAAATVTSISNNTTIVGGFAGVCLVVAIYFAYLYSTSPPRQ